MLKKKKDYVAVEGLLDVILERAQKKKKKKGEMYRETNHIFREYKNIYVQNVDRNSGH